MDDTERELVSDASKRILSIEEHPGFLANLGHPESLVQLSSFLRTPGLAGTWLEAELRPFGQAERGPLLSGIALRDRVRRLREWLVGHPIEVIGEEEAWIPVQVHTLYRPPVAEATAKLEVVSEESGSDSCSLEFLGIGGGSDHKVTLSVGDALEAREASLAVSYLLGSRWEHCRQVKGDGEEVRFPRLVSVEPRCKRLEVHDIETLQAAPEWGGVADQTQLDLRATTGSVVHTLAVASGTTWKLSAKVKLEALGLECGSEVHGTHEFRTEMSYSLPAGRFYEALRFVQAPHWWWRVL